MATPKKPLTSANLRINLNRNVKSAKASEPILLRQRIRELDREFARQTKQLTQLTKDLQKKLKDKLTGS